MENKFHIGENVITISKFKGQWKINKGIYEIVDNNIAYGQIEVRKVYGSINRPIVRKYIKDIFLYDKEEEAQKECDLRNSKELYKRYEKMEEKAGDEVLGRDWREGIGDLFGKALRDGKGNMTLAEFLNEIEEWNKSW